MTSGEEDFTKRSKAFVDLKFVDGVAILTPTVAACVPASIENPAIAYDQSNDRFKVDIEALGVGTLPADISNEWARELGQIDLARVLGAALSHANPVIARLTDGSAFIDPRDVSDRAARLVGKVYGDQDVLQQRATTKELIVQIQHQGSEKDPTQIRALTTSDKITPEQTDETKFKATVTQAAKDRTITDVSYVGTLKQIDETWAAAGNKTIWDPAAGKKVRVKLLSLELSADVDLGFRFGAAGTIYYLRTSAGPIATNYVGANFEGSADDLLILNASGACTVKGYVIGEEI